MTKNVFRTPKPSGITTTMKKKTRGQHRKENIKLQTVPRNDGTVPRDDGTVPRNDGTVPRDDGTVPRDDGTVPRDDGTVPRNDGTVPRNDGTVPRNDGTVPRDDGTVPRDDGTVPRDEGTVPEPAPAHLAQELEDLQVAPEQESNVAHNNAPESSATTTVRTRAQARRELENLHADPSIESRTVDSETSEKTPHRTKKELKEQQEKKKKERRDMKKQEKQEDEELKRAEEAEKREKIETVVAFYKNSMKRLDQQCEVRSFSLNVAKDFITDRIHYYKRANDVDFLLFYRALQEHCCVYLLAILHKSYVLRKSAVDCGKQDRENFDVMNNMHNKYTATMFVVDGTPEKAVPYIDNFVTNYLFHQDQIRYDKCELPGRLKKDQLFQEYFSRWKAAEKSNFNWDEAREMLLHFASYHENLGTNQSIFRAMLYNKLAETEHRVLVDDGCMLAKLLLEGIPMDRVDKMYHPFVTCIDTL